MAEHADRRIWLAQQSYDQLAARLLDLDEPTFAALFGDYRGWRRQRAASRLGGARRAHLEATVEAIAAGVPTPTPRGWRRPAP